MRLISFIKSMLFHWKLIKTIFLCMTWNSTTISFDISDSFSNFRLMTLTSSLKSNVSLSFLIILRLMKKSSFNAHWVLFSLVWACSERMSKFFSYSSSWTTPLNKLFFKNSKMHYFSSSHRSNLFFVFLLNKLMFKSIF